MEKRYVVTILVTCEHELAIKNLYQLKGWAYLKLAKPSLIHTPIRVNSIAAIKDDPNKQSLPDTEELDPESTVSVTEKLSPEKLQKSARKQQKTVGDELTGFASSVTEYCSGNEDTDANSSAVKEPQEGICTVCGVATTDQAMQELHQQMDCSNILQGAKTPEGYFCSTCNVTISASNTFINHLLNGSCGSQSCGECGLLFTHFVLYEHHQNMLCLETLQANNVDTGYYCKGCWSTFKESSTFIKHKLLRSCHGAVLSCEFCGKSFTRRRKHLFSAHIRNHLDDRPYLCTVCGNRYLRSTGLRLHMRTHTGEKPHSCRYCPLKFTTGGHRNNHEKLNHLELPLSHVCHICGKGFKLKARLTSHLSVHVEGRNFPCSDCDVKCKTKQALNNHLKIHFNKKDQMCNVCGKGFITQRYLNAHKRRHTGPEKWKHSCDDCGKKFIRRDHLILHERTHSGDKPYVCMLCDYSCVSRGNLCNHIKTVHNMNNPAPYATRIASLTV